MNKIIKVFSSLVLVLLLMIMVSTPKVDAAIAGDDVVELRGVWVATVSNIDIAKQNGVTKEAQDKYKQQLIAIMDRVEALGLNAIFFQIRPANDALYESQYNPYSSYLAGLGVDPGWDMLSWFTDECHARGIELHAWLNPYRVTGENVIETGMTAEQIKQLKLNFRNKMKEADPDTLNPVVTLDEEEFLETIVAGKEHKLIFNPARQASIDHITNTIKEIIENYDVDGIHFDDYFYPNGGIESGIDQADYQKYIKEGGTLSIADWRRSNVDKMIEGVHEVVEAYNEKNPDKDVAFGVSPSAVWAPSATSCPDRGAPGGTENIVCGSYSSYTDLYADTKKWVEEEWLDYILPQVYYDFGSDYKEIVKWWANVVKKVDVKLYVGTAIYRVSEWQDGLAIKNQFDWIKANPNIDHYVDGFVLFSYKNLVSANNEMTIAQNQLKIYCNRGALLPVYNQSSSKITEDVKINVYKVSSNYSIQFNEVENANGYVLYGVPKGTTDIDFNASGIAIKKAYNQTTGDALHIETVTQSSVANFYYVLRVYDRNNEEYKYYTIDFEQAIENTGAQINVEYDDRTYTKGEEIVLKIKADSDINLPVTVKVSTSLDGGAYRNTVTLTKGEDGYYTYTYSTFKDGTVTFKIVSNDTDVENTLEVGPFGVGQEVEHKHNFVDGVCSCGEKDPDYVEHTHEYVDGECECGEVDPNYNEHQHNFVEGKCECGEIDPNYKKPTTGGGSGCAMSIVAGLPLVATCALILLRKREF